MLSSPQRHKEHEVLSGVIPAQAGIQSMDVFRQKRKLWTEWLTDDEHSIQTQIDEMIYDHSIYKTLGQFSTKQSNVSSTLLPPVINWYLNKSYAVNQFMAIRRLCDKPSKNNDDCISLPRLLSDIKENIKLFTRENFVCFDGAPFDPTQDKLRHDQEVFEATRNGGIYASVVKPFRLAELRHKAFDKLLKLHDKTYQPTGFINESLDAKLIDKVSSYLGCCSKIEAIASKYHAHASDKNSREKIPEHERKITFSFIEKCHAALLKVSNFIGSDLLSDHPICISYPQFKVFENFDEKIVDDMESKFRDNLEKNRNIRLFDN